ncbi:MAG: hypothetical protein KME13_11345 [Myxacorys californica WJT36-NPBG1]|jgi:hypothetical protein|nr:hypothetical protein [Myxacorys californica WJT36-NPBG1]
MSKPVTWQSISQDMAQWKQMKQRQADAIAELERLAKSNNVVPSSEVVRLLAIVKSDSSQVA